MRGARNLALLGTLTLLACKDKADDTGSGPTSTGTWMRGLSYEWEYFNHRVSHLTLVAEGSGASLGVIGGTSTTNVYPDLPDGCDPDLCDEFPFPDTADVTLDWAQVTTSEAVFGEGSHEIVADAAGVTETVSVAFDGELPAGAELTAVLQGWSLDTDYPLSGGEACYDPALGWHLRTLAVEISDVALDGDAAQVELSVAVAAGNSLEDVRLCVDEVREQAQVPVRVHVLVVATTADIETEDVAHSLAYEYKNDDGEFLEQPDPDVADRPLGLDQAFVGWSALRWDFHVDDEEDRGAYVRRLEVGYDTDAGWASGHANNYSPPTQLSGFDYAFEGRLVGVDLAGTVASGQISLNLPAELDDDGNAVVTSAEIGTD